MSSFAYIKPQNTLYKDYKIAKVQKQILEKITDLPQEIRNKHSTELLKMVCNCIEASINNTGKKEKAKINKHLVCIQIYSSLFGNLTPNDLDTIGKNIEYLHDNGQIVKYSFWRVATATAWNWFKSKL
jgi:hypothetical protein